MNEEHFMFYSMFMKIGGGCLVFAVYNNIGDYSYFTSTVFNSLVTLLLKGGGHYSWNSSVLRPKRLQSQDCHSYLQNFICSSTFPFHSSTVVVCIVDCVYSRKSSTWRR